MIKITNTGSGEIQLPFANVQPGETVEYDDGAWREAMANRVVQSLVATGVLVAQTVEPVKTKPGK